MYSPAPACGVVTSQLKLLHTPRTQAVTSSDAGQPQKQAAWALARRPQWWTHAQCQRCQPSRSKDTHTS